MPKFGCRCGHVMNLSTGWSPWELALVPENRIEDIAVKLDEGETLTGEQFFDLIDEVRIRVLRCPDCNRIWLNESSNIFSAYVRDRP